MSQSVRRREVGRGERVLPGLWRLRLPLPWPGVPHGNAWALAAGDGIVLVDTGAHHEGSFEHLERALAMCNLTVEQVRLVVCTHAHSDHYGQAAPVVERAGCELWMHPDHAHGTATAEDPEAHFRRRLEIARASGVPASALDELAGLERPMGTGIAGVVAPERELVDGVEVETDLGTWVAVETPGHAPSHVCLFQAERRLLISGDHLLGRVSLFFDYGYTPDPTGEFLHSLDVVERLGARLCLPGHGRTFADVQAHIEANRLLVGRRTSAVLSAVTAHGPIGAFGLLEHVYPDAVTPATTSWWLNETLSYLAHLEALGVVQPAAAVDGSPRWTGIVPGREAPGASHP